jgi:hypothetical protein
MVVVDIENDVDWSLLVGRHGTVCEVPALGL